MSAETWDSITTAWNTETATWMSLYTIVVTESGELEVILSFEDSISARTWTPEPTAADNAWVAQTEIA